MKSIINKNKYLRKCLLLICISTLFTLIFSSIVLADANSALVGKWVNETNTFFNPRTGAIWYGVNTVVFFPDGTFFKENQINYLSESGTEYDSTIYDEGYTLNNHDPDEDYCSYSGTFKSITDEDMIGLTGGWKIFIWDNRWPDDYWITSCGIDGEELLFEDGPYNKIGGIQTTQTPEITPIPIEPEMKVTLSSDYFKKIDEEIIITIKLTDQMGESAMNQTVTLENLDDGSVVDLTTDRYGNAMFKVKHTLKENKTYNYKLSGLDVSKAIKIPVRSGQIEVEINPITNKPYTGIMADATNELEISLNFYDMPDGTLSVDIPMGTIKGAKENEKVNIELIDGMAKIIYITPAYIPEDAINGWNEYLSVWNAENVLVFTYTTWDDEVFEYELPIDLYRPPVMLVHGFTGDATTWIVLDAWLLERKYTTIRKEYYAGNNSIPAQSLELHRNLRKEFDRYNINGVKDGKVDVVAHSMGGLITRYYTNHTEFYTGQVRKLIMVGTPNHGCSWVDLQIGRLQSWLIGKHESAAKQLYQDNPFIKQLNYGESIGAHLDPDIQYALVYSYSIEPIFFWGDVVVAATSAVLNGVESFQVQGDVHSGAINATPIGVLGTPITDDVVIFNKIQTWLSADIFRPALKNIKVELMKIDGKVEIKTWDGANRVDKIIYESVLKDGPYKIDAYDDIVTGDSKVIIRVSVNDTTVGYINLDKNSHIRIGNASSRYMDIKMLKGKGRYITFKNGGIHYAVEIKTRDGEWQTVTGLDTDFVISLDDETQVLLIEGEAIIAAQTDTDEIDQRTLDSDDAVYIDYTGDISRMDADDFNDTWWEDGFYKIPIMTRLTESAVGLVNKMILKAQSMGYSIYVILITVLILVLIILKSIRHKWLLWFFMIAISVLSSFMLYYFASDMQIPILSGIDNLLCGLNDSMLKIGAGVILAAIVLSGLISLVAGKKRRHRGLQDGGDDDYDNADDGDD